MSVDVEDKTGPVACPGCGREIKCTKAAYGKVHKDGTTDLHVTIEHADPHCEYWDDGSVQEYITPLVLESIKRTVRAS